MGRLVVQMTALGLVMSKSRCRPNTYPAARRCTLVLRLRGGMQMFLPAEEVFWELCAIYSTSASSAVRYV
eukprot:16284859-Heterocapsa_arctica.AAC.1